MQLLPPPAEAVEELNEQDLALGQPERWELKTLKPIHKTVASLVAQGMKYVEVARIVDLRPEYISMLMRQQLMKDYVAQMCEVTGARLEALFEKSVDVIADTLENGSEAGRLKAARLQLEATKRIGHPDPTASTNGPNVDRLEKLAERLIQLQSGVRKGITYDNETSLPIPEADV